MFYKDHILMKYKLYKYQVDLANFAHKLDEDEEKLLNKKVFLIIQIINSQNVDESGNFSLDVLRLALQSKGLQLNVWTLKEDIKSEY